MNLLKVLATVSGMTFISRVLVFVRDAIVARIFGAGEMTDAFFVAFRIPNLLRRLFGEGAFSQAFVPILGEFKARRSAAETKTLVDHVATVLTWSLIGVTVVGIVAAPFVVWLLASGVKTGDTATFDLAVLLTRIMFPYITLIALAAGASAILNTWREFAMPAFTPVL